MAKPRILVIGNSLVELQLRTKNIPVKEQTVTTTAPYTFVPSGKGVVSSISAAQFGSDVLFCTKLGEDSFGDKLKFLLLEKGIDPRFVFADKKRPTGLNTVIIDNDSSKRVISYLGANSTLSDANLEDAFVSYPDAVLVHGELSDEIIYETVSFANSKKIPVTFDPSGVDFNEFDFNALGDIEIFTLNVDEARIMTGVIPDDVESCLRACIRIINIIKCHYVVIKLGQKGCFVFDGVYSEIVPAFDTDVVDRSGVGTVFNAGLLHMYLQSGDIIKGAVFANMAASICLTRQGEFSSIPTAEDIDKFINKHRLNFKG